MNKIKKLILDDIKKAVKVLTSEDVSIELANPALESHGDFSTNISLILAKKLQKNPMEVAEEIVSSYYSSSEASRTRSSYSSSEASRTRSSYSSSEASRTRSSYSSSDQAVGEGVEKSTSDNSSLPRQARDRTIKFDYLEKVEAVKPGFINFWISKEYLFKNLEEAKDEGFGAGSSLTNRKIMVEFTDPNPFKEFHIGHLYSNTVGESISRLLESQGAEVRRVCYQGDVGMHVAKAIFGMSQKLKIENLELKSLEEKSFEERAKFLGESYALGATEFEQNEKSKQEIASLNKVIFDKSDPVINELYDKGKAWSLEYFESIYKRLGMKFEKLYFESEAGEVGLKLVKEFLGRSLPAGRQVFEESDGAIIFPGKKYGLHNRVFINSQGLPTYEAKEMGLAPTKYLDYPYDQSIIITGNEVNEYFKVVLRALSLIRPDLSERTIHISHGMVKLPEGKMSSRTGKVLTGIWMLEQAKEKITQKYPDITPDIAEKVAVGAIKYALLRSGIGRDIEFSFDESISLEGNSGPYLQYAYARTQSVLAKSPTDPHHFPLPKGEDEGEGKLRLQPEELQVLRSLTHYPEVIEEAAEKFSPNIICTYLYGLAQKFNHFYQKHKIIGSDQQDFRLVLTSGVAQTLVNGLTLLGVPIVEKM